MYNKRSIQYNCIFTLYSSVLSAISRQDVSNKLQLDTTATKLQFHYFK